MKTQSVKSIALAGAGLAITIGGAPAVAAAEQPAQAAVSQSPFVEEGFLKVPGSCKWGHATFDPVMTQSEALSAQAQSIYAEMESA